MSNPLSIIFSAIKTVLATKHYKFSFIALFLIFIAAYILLPVRLTPGNSLGLQLSLLTARDYILLVIFAAAASLLMLMQVRLLLQSRKRHASTAAQGGVGVFSAFFGGLLATAVCSSCIAAILGFLGAGSILFILENQPYVVTASIILVGVGLYLSARQTVGICENCTATAQSVKQ